MASPTPTSPTITPAHARRHMGLAIGRWRVTGKGVLCLLILSVVALPFLERSDNGMLIESAMLTLVLGAGVFSVGGRRATFFTAIALGAPAIGARWLYAFRPDAAPPEAFLGFAALTLGFVAWQFLRFILRARRVDSDVLCTGVASFLLLAMLWAFVYQLIERHVPGSFAFPAGGRGAQELQGSVALYFSMVTLCTVGFGDIVPVSSAARVCAMLEGATGVFFVAVLISRLVSLYSLEHAARPDDADSGEPRAGARG